MSIYETNPFLLKKQMQKSEKVTLMEYSAFFGSIQIFQYLKMNGVELTPSLWLFTIHSQNAELIHSLEENHVEPEIKSYAKCHKESNKCHHNDIMRYIQENLLQEEENLHESFIQSLKCYNFSSIQEKLINENSFIDLCHYGYYVIANILLKTKDIDVNKINNFYSMKFKIEIFNYIQNQNIQWNLKLKYSIKFKIKIFKKIQNQNIQ